MIVKTFYSIGLTPRQMAVYIAQHRDGLTQAKIAKRLGISRERVRQIYDRAQTKINYALNALE